MKLRRRMLLCAATTCVLLTVLLLVDLQQHLSPAHSHTHAHARDLTYAFQQRHLQRTINGSRESSVGGEEKDSPAATAAAAARHHSLQPPPDQAPDPFLDLQGIVSRAGQRRSGQHRGHWNPTVGELLGQEVRSNSSLWDKFKLGISQDELYRADDSTINSLLQYITSLPFASISEKDGGTQIKLTIEFVDGGRALLKPMRYPREQQTMKNQFYFTDFERHNSEIAAFHLDRLLGFRRAVPTVGRRVNITSELYPLAEHPLSATFFRSPEHNHCFHGKCRYFCDTAHAICGTPDLLEVSLAVFLPTERQASRIKWEHPWRRSYSRRRKAQWETDDEYCEGVRQKHPYSEGRRLLDLVDMAVLDFLIGNMDRHHYETFKMFGNNSAPVHLDHGRGFGRPYHDETSILAPLAQCCLIRHSTLATLLRYHTGPERLSAALRTSLLSDPLRPVLWEPHLAALDRRLARILAAVRSCVARLGGPAKVIIQDNH